MGGSLQRYLYNRKTEGIVAVSEQVKEGLVKLGFDAEHITVIHNGTPTSKYDHIDAAKVEALKAKFDIRPGEFVLGCVSRMKNQVQIFQALAKIEEPIKAVFCGIEVNEELKAIMETFPVPHQIFFEGNVETKEILNYYKIFDTKVLASTMEGLSQSLLEAMALETPVIATAYAGNLDLIKDGENGLLFTDQDIEKLAENILKSKHDDALRNKLIANGKRTALETFNIENTISNYEQYFSGLISEN